jgi:hypothetical protein
MNALLSSFAGVDPSQPEVFDRLLRRAAACCCLERFKQQTSGGYVVGYDQIGETAGTVWEVLSKQGPLTFAALMEEVNAPQSLFFMAIGWLSREHKLKIESANGDYVIALV